MLLALVVPTLLLIGQQSSAKPVQIQTLRVIPVNHPGFEELSEYFQKGGLELRGVISASSGGGNTQDTGEIAIRVTSMAYFIGVLNAPAIPSIGTFSGKLLLRKADERGVPLRGYTEYDVTVSLFEGKCTARWKAGELTFSETGSYIRSGDKIVLSRGRFELQPHLLCSYWNDTIQPILRLNGNELMIRVPNAGTDWPNAKDNVYTLTKGA